MPEQRPQPPGSPTLGRRWKRTAAAALLLLIGGAIVNVAVAWSGSLLYNNPLPFDMGIREEAEPWPTEVPPHWPPVRRVLYGNGLLWTAVRHHAYAYDLNEEDNVLSLFENFAIDRWALGWPCRSLQSELWNEFEMSGQTSPALTNRFDGHPDPTIWLVGFRVDHGLYFLPVRPIWPCFIINTLFYSVIIWLLFFTPFAARRMLRRRRGLCEKCAYPIGVSPVCTECGAAVHCSERST